MNKEIHEVKDILEFQPCLVENPALHGLEPSLFDLVVKYYKHRFDALTADVYIDRYMDQIYAQLKGK